MRVSTFLFKKYTCMYTHSVIVVIEYQVKYTLMSLPDLKLYRLAGGTQYKRPYRDVPSTWVAKSASFNWCMNGPL